MAELKTKGNPLQLDCQPSTTGFHAEVFDLSREIIKALGPEEIIVRRMTDASFNADELMQTGMCFPRCKIEIPASSLCIKSKFNRQRFKQRGFTGAIFADEKRHGRVKFQTFQMPDGRNAKWISVKIFNPAALKPHCMQKRPSNYRIHAFCFAGRSAHPEPQLIAT